MRNDLLVSVGVVDFGGPARTVPRLIALAQGLGAAFHYFEVLYVLPESRRHELDPLAADLAAVPNLRVLLSGEGTGYYRQRLLAASEAIGDVVALLDLDDLPVEDLAVQLAEAHDSRRVLLGWAQGRRAGRLSYALLGYASRNHLTAQATRTIIVPRDLLGPIVARRSAALDLRFEPRAAPSRYQPMPVSPARRERRMLHRGELFTEILLCGAPRFLKAYAAIGFGVALGSLIYALYAVGIILFRNHVQEGWFTTAIAQAGTTGFIAGGMSIMAIAFVSIYERLHGDDDRALVDEVSNTSFFAAETGRNVELGAPGDA